MKCRALLSRKISIGLPSAGFAHSVPSVKKSCSFPSDMGIYHGKNSSVLLAVSDDSK